MDRELPAACLPRPWPARFGVVKSCPKAGPGRPRVGSCSCSLEQQRGGEVRHQPSTGEELATDHVDEERSGSLEGLCDLREGRGSIDARAHANKWTRLGGVKLNCNCEFCLSRISAFG